MLRCVILGDVLIELHIENLGVIEQASLVFGDGLTALTGETGAGKTMLVEAIELLVGSRADATVIRHGTDQARIDARVLLPSPDGPVETVLTRVVPSDGRSRAYIDGRPATIGRLAELTANVIDLHGQHAHQSLLSVAIQRASLDAYGQIDLRPLADARARLTEIVAELATLGGDEKARAREIDLLRFQVDELQAAAIENADEDHRLAEEESTLANSVAHREAAAAALALLRDESSAADAIGEAIGHLANRAPYVDLLERLHGVAAELDDLTAELRNRSESMDDNPQRLTEIRQRRQMLSDLRRKYGDDLAEVLEFYHSTAERLEELQRYDERAAALDAQRRQALNQADTEARKVGAARAAAAPQLAAEVEQRLVTLAMGGAKIEIVFADDPADLAHDQMAFHLAANPGTPPLPLHKVASGGELARAMLALRLVLSQRRDVDKVATLVFDEVDAGIGGAAATAVGEALQSLATEHQVLVVTHLPQVAARATNHLVVDKQVDNNTTLTKVKPVDGDDRVDEIARMLAGETTDVARHHARDLINM